MERSEESLNRQRSIAQKTEDLWAGNECDGRRNRHNGLIRDRDEEEEEENYNT